MSIIAIMATILGIITGLANIPQVIKIYYTKSAKDLSIITNSIFFASSIIWLIYGFELNNSPLIIANVIYIVTYFLIILGYLIYGRK